ncbi:RHS repeat domain-containing protein [Mesoflavibacter zeaxanthinifaciens]|uniref:RHS repeat domain-containing protein n=1 Tax=Mesoflavibacter zeaxanthinifaciens TaxID=393060 RepID=UPI0026ED8695|nr:RHS repeat domain-containing protein [Mesoflavibacter zeaxanthinifaciens]
MLKFLSVISFIVFFAKVNAQDLPEVIPPSPEASSLAKFSEVPVSHYTGVPNISVPLATYNVGSKALPVSLSYHARGIKVEEISSSVGLGWSLVAGGQITRQTRHYADDGSSSSKAGMLSNGNVLSNTLKDSTFFSSQTKRNIYTSSLSIYDNEIHDRIPDKFMIQAGGISANFIFDYTNKKPLLQKYDDLKVEEIFGNTSSPYPNTSNLLIGFIVTDKEGYKYYFGISKNQQREARDYDIPHGSYTITNNNYSFNQGAVFTTYNTWHLMDIESPEGDLVSFNYEVEEPLYLRRSYDDYSPWGGISYATKLKSYQYHLSSIVFKGGKIEFLRTLPREDLDPAEANALTKVKLLDAHNQKIKEFDLHQSFSATIANSIDYTNSIIITEDTSSSKRMFLDSIVEYGKTNFKKPATVFNYVNKSLPNRFSNSQDFWGYHNNAQNGQYLPLLSYFYDINAQGNYEAYPYTNTTIDRKVDTIASLSGMLNSIKYPTGGYVNFEYEHNKGKLGWDTKNIDLPYINPTTPLISEGIGFLHHDLYNGDEYIGDSFFIGNVDGKVKINVSLPTGNYGGYTDYQGNPVYQNEACANPIQNDCRFDITLEGLNGAPSFHAIFAGSNEFTIPPGEYRIIFDPLNWQWNANPPKDGAFPTDTFSVSVNWKELVDPNLIYGAGKRIKRIEYYDENDNLALFKEYDYKSPNGVESGKILGLSSFNSVRQYNTSTNNGGFIENVKILEPYGSTPGSPLSTYQGNTIGYGYVTEFIGDKENNLGKVGYLFTNFKDGGVDFAYEDDSLDTPDTYMSFPYHPPNDFEWLRGLPIKTLYYKNINNTYSLVKSIDNEYMYGGNYYDYSGLFLGGGYPFYFAPMTKRLDLNLNMTDVDKLYYKDNLIYRLPLIHVYITQDETPYGWDNEHFEYKTFHLAGGTVDLLYSTETNYLDSGNFVKVKKYKYDYQNHYQPSSIVNVPSDGVPIIEKYTYPQDFTNPTELYLEDLKLQHRFTPVEVAVYKDFNSNNEADSSELVSLSKTNFDWYNSSVLLPSKIQGQKGPTLGLNQLEDRIEYHKYDDYGNPLEVSKTDGTHIVYIWGYNHTQPIAKIENATYQEVQSYVSGLQLLSDLDSDHCTDSNCYEQQLREALNNLRINLPNAMVTTYTYDPLIGVTSMTDARGRTIYYEYDDFNRLKYVKDEDGYILSENEYHYANQN